MDKLFNKDKIFKVIFLISFVSYLNSLPPINIFRPYDRPLLPEPLSGVKYQFMVGNESSYSAQAFQESFEDFHSIYCPQDEGGVNVLRIYQDKQNPLAAFKGVIAETNVSQFFQKFTMNDEGGALGLYSPSAKFSIPYNLQFSFRRFFDHNLILALYLPVLSMQLKDVKWKPLKEESSDSDQVNNLYHIAKKYGNLDIGPWKRDGIGDLVAQGIFMAEFPQKRPLIQNVRPQLRLALNFPTGKRADVDKILAYPFGNNGSWGVITSAGLDVFFNRFLKAGIDTEFTFLFGSTMEDRIKTSCDQTDLLLFTKLPVFKAYGINAQYNLYGVMRWKFLQFKADYQYFKNHSSKVYVLNNEINSAIANDKQSLQDWSTHSFILSVRCYFDDHLNFTMYKPALFGFLKLGFNGQNAILINSLGLTLTINL